MTFKNGYDNQGGNYPGDKLLKTLINIERTS